MKLQWKILIGNFAIISLVALLFSIGSEGIPSFTICFALTGITVSLIDILIAIIFFIAGSKEWAQGFLLSAGILLLVGLGICSLIR